MVLALIISGVFNALILLAMTVLGLYPLIKPISEGKRNMLKWIISILAVGGVGTIIVIGILTYKVNNEADRKADKLQKSVDAISSQFTPFQDLAKKLYPNLPSSEALEKLQSEMQKIESRTSTLEQKTTPRSLTPEQKARLINSLSPYKRHTIWIATTWSDNKAMRFAEIIEEVFNVSSTY